MRWTCNYNEAGMAYRWVGEAQDGWLWYIFLDKDGTFFVQHSRTPKRPYFPTLAEAKAWCERNSNVPWVLPTQQPEETK